MENLLLVQQVSVERVSRLDGDFSATMVTKDNL